MAVPLLKAWSGYPLKFTRRLLLFGRRKNGYLRAAFLHRQTGRIRRVHYHYYPLRDQDPHTDPTSSPSSTTKTQNEEQAQQSAAPKAEQQQQQRFRYFFHAAYNGSYYRGWQRQPNAKSVQETIETHLSNIFKQPIVIYGCGRTDALVHASQYFFHADLPKVVDFDLLFILHQRLPRSISIFEYIPMDSIKQHSRYDAYERTYDYFIHCTPDPFLDHVSSYYPIDFNTFDWEAVQAATQLLPQYQNYRAFCKSPDKHNSTICQIKSCQIWKSDTKKTIRVQFVGDRYLRGMIRILMYQLIAIGNGKLSLPTFETRLQTGKSDEVIKLAHPQGLFLSRVKYPYLERGNCSVLFDGMSFF